MIKQLIMSFCLLTNCVFPKTSSIRLSSVTSFKLVSNLISEVAIGLFHECLSYKSRTNFYGKSEYTITQSGIQTNHSIQTL